MKHQLPLSYYVIFAVGLILVMAISVAIAVELGLNPYVAMLMAGGVRTLHEVWILRRKGF